MNFARARSQQAATPRHDEEITEQTGLVVNVTGRIRSVPSPTAFTMTPLMRAAQQQSQQPQSQQQHPCRMLMTPRLEAAQNRARQLQASADGPGLGMSDTVYVRSPKRRSASRPGTPPTTLAHTSLPPATTRASLLKVQNGAVTVNYREPTPRVASVPHERQMSGSQERSPSRTVSPAPKRSQELLQRNHLIITKSFSSLS